MRGRIGGLCPFEAGDELSVAGLRITTFSTSHDAADPIGMRLAYGDDVIGYVTDTGYLSPDMEEALYGSRILAIESNHDVDMLRQGPYPAFLKQRIAGDRGHLSNLQGCVGACGLLSDHLECIVGMHLSETNNTAPLALAGLADLVERECHPAQVAVASQGRPLSVR